MTRNSKVSIGLSVLACIGVGVTAFLSAKRTKAHKDIRHETALKKWESMNNAEFDKKKDDDYYSVLTKKDEAIIFVKSQWPALVSGAVTCGCIVGAQVLDITEIAAIGGVAAAATYKYNDAMNYIREKYPDEYEEVKRYINGEAAKRAIAEEPKKKQESYDGRQRYYLPLSEQLVYLYPEDVARIQWFINATIGTEMEVHINDILDFIRYDLGYKDVHLCRTDYIWQFGEDCVGREDFPEIVISYDDVPDETGEKIACKVISITPDPIAVW